MEERKRRKILVLISGSGTNLQALIDASKPDSLRDTAIVRVISDRKDAYGLKRAEANGIPTTHHGILPFKKKYPDTSTNPEFIEARKAYDAELASLVLADRPDLVVCAGFMRILTLSFLDPLQKVGISIINLHPSLHGDLIGADCIKRAWEEFEAGKRTKTGVMVHHVIADVDMGDMIVQKEVEIEGCKVFDELTERIHACEHKLIVEGTSIVLDEAGSKHD